MIQEDCVEVVTDILKRLGWNVAGPYYTVGSDVITILDTTEEDRKNVLGALGAFLFLVAEYEEISLLLSESPVLGVRLVLFSDKYTWKQMLGSLLLIKNKLKV